MIEVDDLHVAYGATSVLNGVSLSIRKGERVAILGGNGCGKSTLARWLAGWLENSAHILARGRLTWNGKPWADYSAIDRTSAVQLVGQFPAQHLSGRAFTVAEEVAFGPENLGLPAAEIVYRRDAALAACRLDNLAGRDPFSLSGGEQQRLVIAAALALRPELLILDEPFSNLDPEAREHTAEVLRDLGKDVTLVVIDADPDAALQLAERFVFLQEGKILADGDARTVLLDPKVTDMLGLPISSQSFVEIMRERGVDRPALPDLPLSFEEAAAGLQGEPAC